ncbi:unnamed protein product [Aspergillus niger]|uniref:Contig An11c0340, genomic contig n=1 Tax=Aspergillus niger (strain ATCC MYA-4892 / CBS 513.88 / FGSC A1513) TaxID=425011 RepID=A5ABM7_ASPNC|nr:unnamed protein product [Aspergillus niger]
MSDSNQPDLHLFGTRKQTGTGLPCHHPR